MSLDKLLGKVAAQGADQSVATAGGGDYTPPAAGLTGARLVGYYEVGLHEFEYQGVTKTQNEVQLVFELIGKKHPPREVDGTKIPVRITVTTNLSQNEKAWFYKWFSALRTEEKHFAQLLGKPLLLEIEHTEKERNGKKTTYANVKKESLRKPIIQVVEMDEDGTPTGNLIDTPFAVGPAITELKALVWDFADADDWDNIYIAGEYPERKDEKTGKVIAEAKSKNAIQLKIASALNFKAFPVYDYAASKLVGGTVTKEGVEALDDVVGDVDNSADDGSSRTEEDDPMAGVS